VYGSREKTSDVANQSLVGAPPGGVVGSAKTLDEGGLHLRTGLVSSISDAVSNSL